jgi:hypothetical protein
MQAKIIVLEGKTYTLHQVLQLLPYVRLNLEEAGTLN